MKKKYNFSKLLMYKHLLYSLILLCSVITHSQTINFTIDSATDDGTNITETISNGGSTYILTISHPGNEELDDLGGGDQIFFLSTGGDTSLQSYNLSITKDSNPTNFTLNSLDYDTLGPGGIAISNQSGAEIASNMTYSTGAGSITFTNTANAINISSFNIIPSSTGIFNDFGFHNINVTFVEPNTAPVATAFGTPTVAEDAINVALADDVQISDADGDDQTVAFTITGGTLNIGTAGITFPVGTNGTSSFSANGSLANINAALDAATFTPTSNLNGTGAGTIAFISNDGTDDSNTATVTFNITAVNDAPSFTRAGMPTQSVNEDSGAQTVNGFMDNIDDGDAEATQVLTFNVSNNNNALFLVQPDIDEVTGNLTFTPATDAFGTATVTVNLSDDGGTTNGGSDTSANQTFTIVVNQVNDTTPVVTSISIDSGSSSTDFITNDNTPSLSGTAEPGSAISILVDLGSGPLDTFNFGISETANASGNFTIDYPTSIPSPFPGLPPTPVPPLSDGSANFQVVSRLNGVTLTSMIVNGTIDTTNPSYTSATTASFVENGTGTAYTAIATDATAVAYTITGGVDQGDLSITSSGVVTFNSAPDFEAAADDNADNDYVIDITATDLAGNTSVQTVTITVTDVDEIAPTVTITSGATDPTGTSPIPVSITFSEEVSGFELGDITVGNGSPSNLSTTDNIIFTVEITPATDGAVTVDITNNVATDTTGNGNDAASQFSIVYSSTLSITDNSLSSDSFSYANPVSNSLTIESSLEIATIEVYSMSGSLVASGKGNSVDTSALASGIYMAIITAENGQNTSIKVVK